MLVLITYDVNTEDAAGRRRLRQIAKQCVNYGQRVQNSVFECLLDTAQCRMLQAKLCSIMDCEKDSLRFYYLGKRYENKIEHFGCKASYLPEDTLIILCEPEASRISPAGSHPKSTSKYGILRKILPDFVQRCRFLKKHSGFYQKMVYLLWFSAVAPHTGSVD